MTPARHRPAPRARRAFTLVEAIATMAILGAVGSVVSVLIMSSVRSYSSASTGAQLQAELSTAMARMTRELRWVGIDPTSAPVVPLISSVTSTSITWNTNYSLSLSSGQIQYVENGGSPAVLLQNVTSFTIATYDESNAALGATLSGSACNPIRRIELQVTTTRNGVSQTLRSRVFLRGLMSGA